MVDDADDHASQRLPRLVPEDLDRGATFRSDKDDIPFTGTDGIHCDHRPGFQCSVRSNGPDEHDLLIIVRGVLDRRDDGADHFAQDHEADPGTDIQTVHETDDGGITRDLTVGKRERRLRPADPEHQVTFAGADRIDDDEFPTEILPLLRPPAA